MPSGTVVVVGAVNVDYVVVAPRLPGAGETIVGRELEIFHGGKGANAAVAAVRAGSHAILIAAVGDDAMGQEALRALAVEGVDISHVAVLDDVSSGAALITVDAQGENQITLGPGANGQLTAEMVDLALDEVLVLADIVLVSAEIPYACIELATRRALAEETVCVLNPAPVIAKLETVVTAGLIVTPNQVELRDLAAAMREDADAQTLDHMMQSIHQRTNMPVVVTLGADGCALCVGGEVQKLSGYCVDEVQDTTGAGDTFNGVFCAHLANRQPVQRAALAATIAGGMSVTVDGARQGMPRQSDILAALNVFLTSNRNV